MNIPKIVQSLAADTVISRGNVIAGLQYSSYIRPHNETDCNGQTWPRGHLRDFDLRPFRTRFPEAARLAQYYAAQLSPRSMTDKTVLYAWRHNRGAMQSNGERKTVFYGATLADEHGMILSRHVGLVPRASDVVRYLENAARLWNAGERSRYFDADGLRTVAGFQFVGGCETGPNGRAWLHWQKGKETGPAESREGFAVRWRESRHSPPYLVAVASPDDLAGARALMRVADASETKPGG